MTFAICAVAKNENDYINDWITYHLSLGFDKIFVYDNNDSSVENISTKISSENLSKVEIIPINDVPCEQLNRYNSFWNSHRQDFDWVLFLDIDEFVTFDDPQMNVKQFLSNPVFKDYEQVEFVWKNYGDGGVIERDMSIPIYHSELTPSNSYKRNFVKSFIKGNLTNVKSSCAHVFSHNDGTALKSIFADGTPAKGKMEEDSFHGVGYIRHYRTKTLSEFLKCKCNRTDSFFNKSKTTLDYFFATNPKNDLYVEYLKKLGMLL